MCCGRLLAGVHIDGVAPGDPTFHLHLSPTPTAAREARAFLAQHATGLDATANEAAALCASELVTNGVLHARTALVFGMTLGAERLLVTVRDEVEGRPYPPPPDDERTSGRGLVLVDALADSWGVFDDEDGKTVWFTVARSDG